MHVSSHLLLNRFNISSIVIYQKGETTTVGLLRNGQGKDPGNEVGGQKKVVSVMGR